MKQYYFITITSLIRALQIANKIPSGIPNAPELEDVGEEYLDELVDRSLRQVLKQLKE